MLNFQIRGYGINLCAGTIEDAKVQDLLNAMRDSKSSLAQVMYDNNWREFVKILNKTNVARKECFLLPIKATLKALENK